MEKQKVLEAFELSLLEKFTVDQIKEISDNLLIALKDYNISKRDTDMIVYDYGNEEIILKYIGCMKIAGINDKTIKQYIRQVKYLIDSCGKNVKDITSADVKTYLAICFQRGIKNTTLRNYRSYLQSFFQWLVDEEEISKNPVTSIKKPKIEQQIKPVFSEVELDNIKTANLSVRDRAIIEFFASTGLRVAELCALNRADVDLQTLKVRVIKGKGGKDRLVFMSRVAAYHLNEYFKTRKDNNPALFLSRPDHKPQNQKRLTEDSIRIILKRIEKIANVTDIHPHKFRHTFATTMNNRGMELQDIQKLLGHASITTTLGYINSNDTNLENTYMQHII